MKGDLELKDMCALKYDFDNKFILFELLLDELYCPLP